MIKRLLLLISISIVAQVVVAQWRFSVTFTTSGCYDNSPEVKAAEAQVNYWMGQGFVTFSSKGECEQSRQFVMSQSYSEGGCNVRFIASPCTGSGGGITNGADVLGLSKGGGFYSTNVANEIRDWSNDDMERMLALNKDYHSFEPIGVVTGDPNFDNARKNAFVIDTSKPFLSLNVGEDGLINTHSADMSINSLRDGFNKVEMANDFSQLANKENVQRYVDYCRNLSDLFLELDNPYSGDLTMLLHEKFKEISGFDLDAIMQKLPSERTEAEKQALLDYQEFRKEVTDIIIADIDDRIAHLDEVKDFEMAVLAENCYKDSGHMFLSRTNYKEINTDFFAENSPMRDLSVLIDECNSTNAKTGFHAEIYYNEKTNEYTIAFEGTNSDEKMNDWIKTDANLGFGGIPEQYKMAYKIGEYINNPNFPADIKINFTGHSLGGGLASIAGLITERPTYTYNAAGVNKNIIDEFKIANKTDRNIKAFQTAGNKLDSDPLTSVQEGDLKVPVTSTIIGVVSTIPAIGSIAAAKLSVDVVSGRAAAPAVGDKKQVWSYSGHSIIPMVSYLSYTNSKYEGIKRTIYEKGHDVERQTQESIRIFTGS